MLFGQKLKTEEYAPWKEHYIAYDQLKKLLKEGASHDVAWTEDDESRFVQLLDKELDKVYGFESSKLEDITSKLASAEEQVRGNDPRQIQSKKLERDLDQILEDATHLDRFRRLNYTGFTKIVRKHDRLHPEYRVWPLLQARFRSLPHYTEDYSPLLRRLGSIYAYLDSQLSSSTAARSAALGSVDKDYHSKGYVTLQFWVHPDNLMEVKTRVLRKLPVLVYNREDDEEESDRDPVVTSLYLDNQQFSLYKSLLERLPAEIDLPETDPKDANKGPTVIDVFDSDAPPGIISQSSSSTRQKECSASEEERGPATLRFRWYGKLYERPDIVLERHNELDGRITRVTLKEKSINKFLAGDKSVQDKQARKMRERHVQTRAIDDYRQAANELQRFIERNHLEPMLRTVYRRTAFEIPGDDRVRVILDQDILFMREDAMDHHRPVRDTADWHRADLDQPGIDPQSLLRRGEFARFPYSVLEVRLRAGSASGAEKLPWIEELQKSGLIKEVPHFTKFLHGIAVLFADDDRLDVLPFWLSELDAAQGSNGHAGSSAGTAVSSPGSQGQSGTHRAVTSSGPQAGPSSTPPQPRHQVRDYKFDDDEYAELDSDDSGILGEFGPSDSEEELERDVIGLPTRVPGKLGDEESEDEEVSLPQGVERPSQWIKNQSSPKIEAKVWLANERTFNKWLHITCLMSALTFTLYSSINSASSERTATIVAYVLFALTIFTGVWGYTQYLLRIKYIRSREGTPMDAPLGPIVVSLGLLCALILNFWSIYHSASQSRKPEIA